MSFLCVQSVVFCGRLFSWCSKCSKTSGCYMLFVLSLRWGGDSNCRRLYGFCIVWQFHGLQGFVSLRAAFDFLYLLFVYVFIWFCRRRDFWRAVHFQEQSFCMRFGRFSIMLLERVTIRLERTNGSSLSTFPEPHSQKQSARRRLPQR